MMSFLDRDRHTPMRENGFLTFRFLRLKIRQGNVPAPFIALVLLCALGSSAAQTKPSGKSSAASTTQEARIQKIEALVLDIPMGEKEPPLRLSLAQAMSAYNVPGVSVAVIDNYKIVWAKGYGVIGTGATMPVGTGTLFQAGSISKPVAATAALALVQKGKLSLDENVNEKLKSWKVPDDKLTKDQKVTLRRLMSHTAGLTVHGFPGYGAGRAAADHRPDSEWREASQHRARARGFRAGDARTIFRWWRDDRATINDGRRPGRRFPLFCAKPSSKKLA